MSTGTPHRPGKGGTTREQLKGTENPATTGHAGTIQRAYDHTPEGASRELVERVVFTAIHEDRDPAAVWPEVTESTGGV